MTLRPLLLSALLSAPFAAAQFTSAPSARPAAPSDSRLQIPTIRLQVPDARLQIPAILPRLTLSGTSRLTLLLPRKNALIASNSTCYTMRSYEFSQPEASSGVTKLSGVTTCQPASSTHLRTTILTPARLR